MFTLIWLGAALVSSNAKLLGYRLTILPAVAFVGYSLTPLMGAILIWTLSPGFFLIKVILAILGGIWSLSCALRLLDLDPALEDRRLLASFPFVLYFFLISWIILTS